MDVEVAGAEFSRGDRIMRASRAKRRFPSVRSSSAGGFLSLSASQALASQPEELRRRLRCEIVIVGASHSEFTDVHHTPAGDMPGTFVQANYAEALLDARAYRHPGPILAVLIEPVLGPGPMPRQSLFRGVPELAVPRHGI